MALNIASINIRGLITDPNKFKLNFLINYMEQNNNDIILIQEWGVSVRNINKNPILNHAPPIIPLYDCFYDNYETAIYVKRTLHGQKIISDYHKKNYLNKNKFQFCAVKINENLTVFSLYRSPSGKFNEDTIHSFFEIIECVGNHCIGGGDINLKHEIWGANSSNNDSQLFIDYIYNSDIAILDLKTATHYIDGINDTNVSVFFNHINNNYKLLNIVSKYHKKKKLSDHYFIHLKIDQYKNISFKSKRWNLPIDTKKYEKYKNILHNKLENFNMNDFDSVDILNDILTDIIINSMERSLGYKYISNTTKGWFNQNLKKTIKETKKARVKYYKYKNLVNKNIIKINTKHYNISHLKSLHDEYKRLNKIKKAEIKKAKDKQKQKQKNILIDASNNPELFWKQLNQLQQYQPPKNNPVYINKEKVLSKNNYEKAKALQNFYSNPPQPKNISKINEKHYKEIDEFILNENEEKIDYNLLNKFNNNKKKIVKNLIKAGKKLNSSIKYYELRNVISDLKCHKAIGPDNIHNQMIIQGGYKLHLKILNLFNKCLNSGIFPKKWNIAYIVPIEKPGRDGKEPKNNRPICISSALGRLLERIMANRLQTFVVDINLFNFIQSGFLKNRSTDDVLANLVSDVLFNLERDFDTFIIMSDLSKAYDTVWINALLYKLKKLGIHGNFYKTIKNFLLNRYNCVKIFNYKHTNVKKLLGVPQGSPISPILFIIFLADYYIPPELDPFIKMGGFCDDINWWTLDNPQYTKNKLQQAFKLFYDFCNKWKLVLNIDKCYSIRITRRKTYPDIIHSNNNNNNSTTIKFKSHFYINKQYIKHVDKIKYLGLNIDYNFNLKFHINQVKNKMLKVYNYVYKISKLLPLTSSNVIELYKLKARSIAEYSSIFYMYKDTDMEIKSIEHKFLRLAFGQFQSCNLNIMYMASDLEPLDIRIEKILGKFYFRLLYADTNHPLRFVKHKYIKHVNYYYNIINPNMDNVKNMLNYNNKTLISDYKKRKHYHFHQNIIYRIINFVFDDEFNKIYIHKTLSKNDFLFNNNDKYEILLKKLPNVIVDNSISALPNYKNFNDSLIKNLIIDIIPFNNDYDISNTTVFFSDGSNMENPGPGGLGFYCKKPLLFEGRKCNYPTIISFMEMNAIINILRWIIKYNKKFNKILILSDCEFILKILNGSSYPKWQSIKIDIDKIFHLCNKIFLNKITNKIIIKKIKAHTNQEGNDYADAIAKAHALYIKKNGYKKNEFINIKFVVHISQWYQIIRNRIKNEWILDKKEYLLYNKQLKNMYKYIPNYTSRLYKLFRKMTIHPTTSNIIKLITNHNPLNMYRYNIFFKKDHIKEKKNKQQKML